MSNDITNNTEILLDDLFMNLLEEDSFSNLSFIVARLTYGFPDVDRIIAELRLPQVTSANIFRGENYDPDGLFSEEIFGPVGSPERRERFAYIDLSNLPPLAQPIFAYILSRYDRNIFDGIMYQTKMYYDKKQKQILPYTGTTDSDEILTGPRLLQFIVDNYRDIQNLSQNTRQILKKHGKLVLVNKVLVLPPDLRPIIRFENRMQIDELNSVYITLIRLGTFAVDDDQDEFVMRSTWARAQHSLLTLYKLISTQLGRKSGLIRSAVLGKRVDFTGRAVVTNNADLQPYEIGVPARMCARIGRYFVLYTLNNGVSKEYKDTFRNILAREFNIKTLDMITYYLDLYADGIKLDEKLERLFFEAIKQALDGKYVLAKRDPALHRESWAPYKLVVVDGMAIQTNPGMAAPHNLDYDGDTFLGKVKLYDKQGNVVFEGEISRVIEDGSQ